MLGAHLVELQFAKAVVHESSRSLGGVPAIPERFSDPVTEFGLVMLPVDLEPDTANQTLFAAEQDGQRNRLAVFARHFLTGDPLLRHALFVGVRDRQGRIGDVWLTGEALNALRVTEAKGPQKQALGFNRWLQHGLASAPGRLSRTGHIQ